MEASNSTDKAIKAIGEYASHLNLVLIVLIFVDVVFRYLFNTSHTWIIELEWHLFSLVFLLGFAYTLQQDEHVRVDVFYNKWSVRKKRRLNLLGHLIFLIPWCIVGLSKSYHIFINSWAFREGSPDPGGLPARYIIKGIIVISFFLLFVQGVSQLYKILHTEIKKK